MHVKTYIFKHLIFVPDEPMIMALKLAASSGVDVRIMVPDEADHFFYGLCIKCLNRYTYKKRNKIFTDIKKDLFMLKQYVQMDVYAVQVLQIQISEVFKLNFEINAIIYDSDVTSYNENIFINDMNDCKFLSIEDHNKRSFKTKTLESIVKLIFPLL